MSISINAISMDFGRGPRAKRVLKDVSINIDDGEIVGYAGLNGAGKTTTMRISAGVISPVSGDVMINHISMKDQKLEASRHVAWIPEAPMLDPIEKPRDIFNEIGSYLSYTRNEIREKFTECMERVALTDHMDKRIGSMSNGMKKRMHLAIGFFINPDNYLMDEPFNGLDPEGTSNLRDLIKQLKKENKAVLLSTHVLNQITDLCDRIVIIKKGEIVRNERISEIDFHDVIRSEISCDDKSLIKNIDEELQTFGEVNIEPTEKSDVYTLTIGDLKVKDAGTHRIWEVLENRGIRVISMKQEVGSIEDYFKEAME